MKKFLLAFVMGLLACTVMAQNVSLSEATVVADRFLQSQGKVLKGCAAVAENDEDTLLFIFNAENAFVVVAGDKRVPPILAFTDHTLYNDDDLVAPARMWLDNYRNQIAELKKSRAVGTANATWNQILLHQQGLRETAEVRPLVQSRWGQGDFYNYYCPRDVEGDNNRVVTGCVATAMAQLIYYFRFPESGVGSYSYVDSTYGVQSADYSATTYNYEAMCDEPTSINTEISKLIYTFGVGVDMHYGVDGSGMYNHSAARVLRTHFKYSPQTEYLYRDSTTLDWDSVIVNHLNRQIPMYYAGWSVPNINGHGFICDGYKIVDSCYYFHFNFGWDGYADGYFYTDNLFVSGNNFNLSQELIVNAYPDTTLYDYPVIAPLNGSKVLTSTAGSFTDGTPAHEAYRPNMDFTWTIRPSANNVESIILDVTYELAAGDTLWISSPCVNEYHALTADTGHLNLPWECSEVELRFRTDDSLSATGFRANYNAVLTDFCASANNYTSQTGVITDGSGDQNYNDLSTCINKIVLPSYAAISLHIISLDTEADRDLLRIYKFPIRNENLLTTLSGTMSDTTLYFDEKRLALIFESDEQNNAAGFEIEYTGSKTGISEWTETFSVWPNPTTDALHLRADLPIDHVTVCDLQGRTVATQQIGDQQGSVNVGHLAPGVYLLRIHSDNQITTRKFIKQ